MLGAVSAGALWFAGRPPDRSLDVRVFATETAASYEGLPERATEYVEAALGGVHDGVRVDYGGSVETSTEDAYGLVTGGEWPRLLARGLVGGDAGPADDANILVTDSNMHEAPTGAGVPRIAAVGGAEQLAALPPVDDVPDVVPYSEPMRIAQVLVHELGHALGLSHDDGRIDVRGDAAVATPMVSAYAWASEAVKEAHFDAERCACGADYPDVEGHDPHLSFRFSPCAREKLRGASSGLLP